jgi:hypothetical protein
MRFYAVDTKLRLSIVDHTTDEGILVPTKSVRKGLGIICIVHGEESEALSRLIADHLADLESERIYVDTGEQVAFCLGPPDPWLMAIGAVMLEGVIQGLTWDAVKLAVQQALDLLRTRKRTPAPAASKRKAEKSLGFEIYLSLPMLGELYAAIEGHYESYCKIEESMDKVHEVLRRIPQANQVSKKKDETKRKGKKKGKKNS